MQQLLNPFAQKYPENVEGSLTSNAVSVAFNPSGPFAGHYLAAGNADGLVEIWDVESRGVIRLLEGHVKAVSGLSWSRNNRYLLSASHDSSVIVWDLAYLPHPLLRPQTPFTSSDGASTSSARFRTIRFDAPVAFAEFHPRNSKLVLATLACNEVVLVDLRKDGGRHKLEDLVAESTADDQPPAKAAVLSCARWSPCGTRIYAGTTQGELLIIDPPTRFVVHRYKVANAATRQIAFSASGQHIILSSTDRALRVLSLNPITGILEPIHRFQDLIDRTPWNSVGFSGDEEYVMGGAGHKQSHKVFVWDRESGVLVKVLEGPREPLVDSDWHPTRPVIASCSTSGDIYLWQTSVPDNWAAFAPGFEELEENVEYDEREDEFDIEDETEVTRRKDAEEDVDIDVLTVPMDFYRPRLHPAVLALTGSNTPASTRAGDIGEGARAGLSAVEVVHWADAESDDDTWEGFYLSIDLLDPIIENEEG